MVTRKDVENYEKMKKAQELRSLGYPPEVALSLAGVDWTPGMRGTRRGFTREEANVIFAKDDLAWEMAKKEVARERRARKMRKASLFFQIVLAIIMAVAVARMWKLI